MATVTITRRELYDQIWSKPMMHLAKEYGLSDVGMAKLCRRLDIPHPPRGYWAKLEFGHKVKKSPLPNPDDDCEIEMIKSNHKVEPEAETNSEVQQLIKQEREPTRRILVAQTLRGCHELVSKTNQELQLAEKNDYGLLAKPEKLPLDVLVSKGVLHRALLIMDALVNALEKRGYTVKSGPSVEIMGQPISFGIRELVDAVRESDDEEDDLEGSYSFGYNRFRTTHTPSGRLSLYIHEGGWHETQGCRKSWKDAKQQKVEDCLNKFVVGLVQVADRKRKNEIEAKQRAIAEAEAARRRQEEARIRAEKRALQKEERAKVRSLHRQAKRWKQSQDLRCFVEAKRQRHFERGESPEPEGDLAKWIEWALQQADRLDPLFVSPPSILDEVIPEEPPRWNY